MVWHTALKTTLAAGALTLATLAAPAPAKAAWIGHHAGGGWVGGLHAGYGFHGGWSGWHGGYGVGWRGGWGFGVGYPAYYTPPVIAYGAPFYVGPVYRHRFYYGPRGYWR